jgi:hypothetical protein
MTPNIHAVHAEPNSVKITDNKLIGAAPLKQYYCMYILYMGVHI